MSSFHEIKGTLARWPDATIPETAFSDSGLERLRLALLGLEAGLTGTGDLAGLVRQVLARQAVLHETPEPPELTVPRAEGWPSREQWISFGAEIRTTTSSHFMVRARPWRPLWLDIGNASLLDDVHRETPRRQDARVTADPAFADLLDPTGRHYRTYSSPGQREAVRAAFLMQPGSTLLVNLPTGAGKSLVFQAPALAARLDGGLSIIIVPTVALARDLERRFRQLLGEAEPPLAYHGGLDPEIKRAMRSRIRTGEQSVVITSPESALGALRAALFDAARVGRLRYLVIDEAHLVAQWGTEFRPEFQLLAGLRTGLLQESPRDRQLRTLLATATLTEETWWTLGTLFGEMEVVSAVHLRPEPTHWLHAASDEADRRTKVLEALRHLPRPLILYTSRPEDATSWLATLDGLGIKRARAVCGGDMSTEAGAEILEKWASRKLDIIVATSAFGLGVDQDDVRAVVHACVPETVDRYYQEVGRAGRDGKAACSLLVHTPRDLQIARNLAEERIIGVEKGMARWKAMHEKRDEVPGREDVVFVPLTVRPPTIPQDSPANLAWNRRTLLLMTRMGMIALDAVPPPPLERADGESEVDFEQRCRQSLERYFTKSAVRLKVGDHLSVDLWKRSRKAAKAAGSSDDIQHVQEVLASSAPLSEIFCRTYTVRELGIVPEMAGGGCPTSRRRGDDRSGYVVPTAQPIRRVVDLLDRSALPLTPTGELCILSYVSPDDAASRERWYRTVDGLLGRLVALGVLEVAASSHLMNRPEMHALWRRSPLRFLMMRGLEEDDGPSGESPTPRVSVVDPLAADGEHDHLLALHRPLHLLIVPTTFREPGGRGRRLLDLRRHLPLNDFLARLDR